MTAKRILIFLICCFAAFAIFCISFCRLKPDGGIFWTFKTYAPVVVGGDGSSYETAYQFKKGQAGSLATVEYSLIHTKTWVVDQAIIYTNVNLNSREYDVFTFPVAQGANIISNTLYFDVTEYRKKR